MVKANVKTKDNYCDIIVDMYGKHLTEELEHKNYLNRGYGNS